MSGQPDDQRFSTQLLVDLVLDPRDPGYEAAAARRGANSARRWYEGPAVAVGCLVIGFVLSVSWVQTHRAAPGAAKVHDRLVERVRAAESELDSLSASESELTAELDRLRAAALPASSSLVLGLERSQLIAGELPVTGPGLEVRLSEPEVTAEATGVPGRGDRTPTTGGHILTDRDVRSVVNQLWSDGAEAIAVNGIRLTPTSAIRFAGDAVLVDFQPIDSPYMVAGIGDANLLATDFAASDVASRYQTLASARGIGFSFHETDKLSLASSPATSLRYAKVPKGRR